MINDKINNDTTFQSPSQIANQSFDQTNQLNVVEGVTINPVTGAVERPIAIQGNASIVLGYTGNLPTSVQKTVGSTVYTKSLSYSGTVLTGVSSWS